MKVTSLCIISVSMILCGFSTAFTLGFENVPLGTSITPSPDSLVINVFGYGDVLIELVQGTSVVVGNDFENDSPGRNTSPSLNFDDGDQVKVTFLGNRPSNVTFSFVGASSGETFKTASGGNPNSFLVLLDGTAEIAAESGAGLYQIGFQQVPEPSALLLGVLGASLIVLRHRR